MSVLDDIRAATQTLNTHLVEAARLGIKLNVLAGLAGPLQDNTDKSHFYMAKCVVITQEPK